MQLLNSHRSNNNIYSKVAPFPTLLLPMEEQPVTAAAGDRFLIPSRDDIRFWIWGRGKEGSANIFTRWVGDS